MLTMENSHHHLKSTKLPDVGRPRTRPPGEDTILSFKVSDATVKALDAEAARMTVERGPGASKVSRTEAVKVILARWLADRSTPRQ